MMTGTMSMPGMEGQPGITEDQKAKLRAAMEQGIEAMPDHLVFQITCENPDKPMTSLVAVRSVARVCVCVIPTLDFRSNPHTPSLPFCPACTHQQQKTTVPRRGQLHGALFGHI